MTPTDAELDRIRHMSSIAKWTTDDNRAYHHAMIDAGWVPEPGTVGVVFWLNTSGNTSMFNKKAHEFYTEHGQAPAPF